jgi:hypothetical protein
MRHADHLFPMTIELAFEVEYFENKSGMTNQQLADYVIRHTVEERSELVIEAKCLLIRALDGDFEATYIPEGLHGLNLEPGAALALSSGTDVNGTDHAAPTSWFARLFGLGRRKRT